MALKKRTTLFNHNAKILLLRLIAALSMVDRAVTKEEREYLFSLCVKLDFPYDTFSRIIGETLKERKNADGFWMFIKNIIRDCDTELDRHQKAYLFKEVVKIIKADHEISLSEQKVFDYLEANLNLVGFGKEKTRLI